MSRKVNVRLSNKIKPTKSNRFKNLNSLIKIIKKRLVGFSMTFGEYIDKNYNEEDVKLDTKFLYILFLIIIILTIFALIIAFTL